MLYLKCNSERSSSNKKIVNLLSINRELIVRFPWSNNKNENLKKTLKLALRGGTRGRGLADSNPIQQKGKGKGTEKNGSHWWQDGKKQFCF